MITTAVTRIYNNYIYFVFLYVIVCVTVQYGSQKNGLMFVVLSLCGVETKWPPTQRRRTDTECGQNVEN